MIKPSRSSSQKCSQVAQRGTSRLFAISTRGAYSWVRKVPTAFPDCTNNVSSSLTLRGAERLECQDGLRIGRDLARALRAVPAHAVVVFLVGRGRQRVNAGGRRQQLIVGDQGGRCVLQQHVAGVEAGVPGQERRKLREESGQHPEEAALRDA